MKITILCSSEDHPINTYLLCWMQERASAHDIELVRKKSDACGGDILFLISCSEIITQQDRVAYAKSLVIHASNLPEGRGWSPHIWQILEGKQNIPVTLLEAEDRVDSGGIWHQVVCHIPPHALWDEINHSVFCAELALMDYALENFGSVRPVAQSTEIAPTYYRKRSPADSEIDPLQPLAAQFDKIRVADPQRFPAFFKLHGHVYKLRLEKTQNG